MHRASGRWGRSMESVKVPFGNFMETLRIEEEPPIDDEIQSIGTFVEFGSATDFKGFEALLSVTLTTNCFATMFKRKLDKYMMNCDNRLRRFNETLTN